LSQAIECQCCHAPLRTGLADWHFVCPACAYEAADLTPSINDEANPVKPDEVEREIGLKVVRQRNFARIIAHIRQFCDLETPRLLDVGCAHGLFLEMLVQGFDAEGIEPHQEVARQTRARGLKVREGYFPAVLDAHDRFDVIVFNDVLEHIPDLPAVLQACHNSLNNNGILVINLPDASGVFYRLSRMLARTGLKGIFERMWQLHYPSPHLHYFTQDNLQRLVTDHEFEHLDAARLDSLVADGLFDRIAHTGEYSFPVAYLMFIAARLSIPLLGILPADIQLQIFRKRG
jgi:2-polyprenyl-3-methyl-5-hydroxy-6-metoxy-1,4-benzoquinol methylase